MSRKRTPGLTFNEVTERWEIDKIVKGKRIRRSTPYGRDQREDAERYLGTLVESRYKAQHFGERPRRTFRDAAIKFAGENANNRTIKTDLGQLERLEPHIGDLYLDEIHRDQSDLQRFIAELRAKGRKTKTINSYLEIIRRILNQAEREWRDEHNLSWLGRAPKIKLYQAKDARKPRPILWEEQTALLKALPAHLSTMALVVINTGMRDKEVCSLMWEWEVTAKDVPGLLFIIPGTITKNGDDRILFCNTVAASVIDAQRGNGSTHVFTYKGKPILRMLNSGWRKARTAAGLDDVRVHDLRHTFGHRLRQASVDKQDRQELLGHRSGDITDHYSQADVASMFEKVNRICKPKELQPVLSLVRNRKVVSCG